MNELPFSVLPLLRLPVHVSLTWCSVIYGPISIMHYNYSAKGKNKVYPIRQCSYGLINEHSWVTDMRCFNLDWVTKNNSIQALYKFMATRCTLAFPRESVCTCTCTSYKSVYMQMQRLAGCWGVKVAWALTAPPHVPHKTPTAGICLSESSRHDGWMDGCLAQVLAPIHLAKESSIVSLLRPQLLLCLLLSKIFFFFFSFTLLTLAPFLLLSLRTIALWPRVRIRFTLVFSLFHAHSAFLVGKKMLTSTWSPGFWTVRYRYK